MSDYLDNVDHWRERARTTRLKARYVGRAENRRLIKAALEYERLAERAEEQQLLRSQLHQETESIRKTRSSSKLPNEQTIQ